MDKILEPLNDKQREAVLYTEGALLVLAGAGSGKTRVITHRFAHLIKNKGLGLNNILSVTFTNKAAGEMKDRIANLTGLATNTAWIRTFHSMGVLIIRKNPETIGYPRDFVIYDDTDSKNLVKSIMKSLNISTENYHPAGISEKIGNLKDSLVSPEEFAKIQMSQFDQIVTQVYREYEKTLHKNKAVDFPDLISLPIKIFTENPSVLNYYHNLWKYVMVDEFQDTNSAQYRLINLICETSKNVCVVGDDDQSIYGWRGANVDNIYDFQTRYQAKIIPLEQNYRSTQVILFAANSIVTKISGRMEKKLWTERVSEEKIQIIETLTDREEAQVIVETLDNLLAKYDYKDFAVFYRTNAQSRVLEEELLSRNIAYKIFGGQKFYERKEIKDILAYIKLIVNPFDSNSFDRIINVPKRKIGETTQDKIRRIVMESSISFVEALLKADEASGISKAVLKTISELGEILLELNQSMDSITPTNFVKILLEAIHYKEFIVSFDEDGLDRWSNVEELINSIKIFETNNPDATVVDFLQEVTLQTSVDTMAEDDNRNYVSLMTIHNAKGLEFPVVFISGTVDGLIPHISSTFSEKELNEERRLFYVAITRAKDRLYISHSESRLKFGEVMYCKPSPFLQDIPEEFTEIAYTRKEPEGEKKPSYDYSAFRYSSSKKAKNKKNKSADEKDNVDENHYKQTELTGDKISSINELVIGNEIMHRQFGKGKVTFVSGSFIKVNFEKYGVQAMSGNFLSNIKVIKV